MEKKSRNSNWTEEQRQEGKKREEKENKNFFNMWMSLLPFFV